MEPIEERLSRIESMLKQLVERQAVKEFYTPEEFARLVGREAFTCREYCRLGRIQALKKTERSRQACVMGHPSRRIASLPAGRIAAGPASKCRMSGCGGI